MADQINVDAADRPAAPKQAVQPRWGRRLLTLLIATAAVGGFAVVVVYSYDKGQSVGVDTAAPIITAQKGPTKMRPKEPGGMAVPNRDKQVYGRLNVAERPEKMERLLPPPETVVSRPPALPAETSPSNRVALAEQTPEQAAKKLAAIAPAAGKTEPPPPVPPAMRETAKLDVDQPMPVKDAKPAAKSAAEPASKPAPEPAVVAKLAAPIKQTAKPASAAFRVQLASVRSQKSAEKAWGNYKKRHAALFGQLEPKIVRVDLKGKGVYYRLQAGPLADASAARSLCTEAKKRKIGCIIVRP